MRFGTVTAFLGATLLMAPAAAAAAELTPLNCLTAGVCNNSTYAGALWQTVNVSSTGTGVIDSFVRIHDNASIEEGHNTDGVFSNDEVPGNFTHSIQLSDVPLLNINGSLYYEFLLDINQTGANPNLVLNNLQICLASSAEGGSLTTAGNCPSGPASYSMGAAAGSLGSEYVLLNASLNSGSGSGDLFLYIPMNTLGTNLTDFVYLYSQFGALTGYGNNGGFEEWAVRICGETYGSNSTPLACSTPPPAVPEPGTMILLGTGLLGLAVAARRRRR